MMQQAFDVSDLGSNSGAKTGRVTMGKASHLSESHCPHVENGIGFFPLTITNCY